jgi:predicted ATPase
VPYLFLIGAFRTEGRDQAPGLDAALRRIATARGNLRELQLSELTPKNMEVLVSDALRMDAAEAASLANFVHRRTRGNAFFAIQLLTALEIDGLLNFNNGERVWTWNVQDISDREAVRDIAELLTERLVRYAGVELDAIKCLACLGSGAPSSLIAAALDIPVHDVEIAMLGFVEANLVRLHEHGYAFVHDGVQEAAYAHGLSASAGT